MNSDYRINVDKVFSQYPYAREILDRLSSSGYEAALTGDIVRDVVRFILNASLGSSPQAFVSQPLISLTRSGISFTMVRPSQ